VSALTEPDQALCVAYVDGLLSEERRIDFELRLARDPELAEVVQRLLSTDELLRRLGAKEGFDLQRARRIRPWVWAASLAAAAAVLVAIAIGLRLRGAAAAFEVALAPGYESAVDFIDSVPELRGLRPPGVGALRGEDQAPNVGAGDFLARAAEAERTLLERASAASVTAGFFVVPLELARPSAVVISAFTREGQRIQLFPEEPGTARALAAGRHVLPSARFLSGTPGVQYARGFLVPIGSGALDVVVGVQPEPKDPRGDPIGPGGAIAAPVGPSAQGESRALEASGFSVSRLRVLEP
jgi:hypothetical protein